MHIKLRRRAAAAYGNMHRCGLCDISRGVLSIYDRSAGIILIRDRYTDCADVTPDSLLAVLPDGEVIDGSGEPPAELAAHAEIYRHFSGISAIASGTPLYCTAFAQAGRGIKPYGTAHARVFGDMIPCTRKLIPSEIESGCYISIGRLVAETLEAEPNLLSEVGAALVFAEGIYTLASDPEAAVRRMDMAEKIANIAFFTEVLQRGGPAGGIRMPEDMLRSVYELENK